MFPPAFLYKGVPMALHASREVIDGVIVVRFNGNSSTTGGRESREARKAGLVFQDTHKPTKAQAITAWRKKKAKLRRKDGEIHGVARHEGERRSGQYVARGQESVEQLEHAGHEGPYTDQNAVQLEFHTIGGAEWRGRG